MSTTTLAPTWAITNLTWELSDGYVFLADWEVLLAEGRYFAKSVGQVRLEKPYSLIPLESLTEEIVLGWVKDHLGPEEVSRLETLVLASVEKQKNPTTSSGLPWPKEGFSGGEEETPIED